MPVRPIERLKQGLVGVVGTRLPRAAARFYPDILWQMPAAAQNAYLTFDDGPNPGFTEQIVNVLGRHGALATFFLLGEKVEMNSGLVRELHSAGHGIGNHSFSHPDAWNSASSFVLEELDRTSEMLEDVTGDRIHYMRPPYGRFTREMRAWCRRRRHRLTMWDVGPGDYLDFMSEGAVLRHVRIYLRPGSIVALHDNPRCATKTPAVLDRLLRQLVDEGWTFLALPAGATFATA